MRREEGHPCLLPGVVLSVALIRDSAGEWLT
jgi:hypothetical protein